MMSMKDKYKSQQALIEELSVLKLKIAAHEQEAVDRCRAEEELRESEMRFRALFENNIDWNTNRIDPPEGITEVVGHHAVRLYPCLCRVIIAIALNGKYPSEQ